MHKSILPWQDIIWLGVNRLRLSPQQIWHMSYLEFQMATRHFMNENQPLQTRDLIKLMQQYPDEIKK